MQNYKVFINDDLIFFEYVDNFNEHPDRYSEYQLLREEDLKEIIDKISTKTLTGKFCIPSDNPTFLFKRFAANFNTLDAAGGLVINNKNELLMIHRFGKWDFPKGHVEKNESISQAAIREVSEETAAKNLTITQKLSCTFHMYDNHSKMLIKRTHWYLMETNENNVLKPQLEENILAAVWVPFFTLDEYIDKTYPAYKDLIQDVLEQRIFNT